MSPEPGPLLSSMCWPCSQISSSPWTPNAPSLLGQYPHMLIHRRGNEPLPQNFHEVHSDQTSLITLPVPSLNQSLSGRVTHLSGLSHHVPHTKGCNRDRRALWTEGGRSGADLPTNLTYRRMNAGGATDAAYQCGQGLCQHGRHADSVAEEKSGRRGRD